jgi:ribosomal protein S18 acetylase RimI-like enzyme
MGIDDVRIEINPVITDEELFSFYQRNHICEEGYGRIEYPYLRKSSLVIGAFESEKLVGIARAMFDGMAGVIMEFCLELEYQGTHLEYENGSLIGKDDYGLGKRMGCTLINELFRMGADFIDLPSIVENYEESFYESIGFERKDSHLRYYIDNRPYKDDERYKTIRRTFTDEMSR